VPNLAKVCPIARGRLVPGIVVCAHVPFAEGGAWKTRPAIVKALDGWQVTVLPAYSSASRLRFPHLYVELRDLYVAGLSRPTGVRRQEVAIDVIEIIDVVGQLSDVDMRAVLPPARCSGDSSRGTPPDRRNQPSRTIR
jgi:hypothetical protein